MAVLSSATIVHGLTGGIACYKGASLVRALVKEGATVHVVMTESAQRFVTPLTLQTLSQNPVATELFDLGQESEIGHIRLADEADVVLIAPATANAIAKLAHGLADDLLSTIALATRAPLVVAPAMNVNMLANPRTQENLERLRETGAIVVDPTEGALACGWEGAGRLADESAILAAVRAALTPQDLRGQRWLVSAGPTRERIDPVRFLSNRSTGRMGYAIAAAARRHGAVVTLVSGPTTLEPPADLELVSVVSAAEMATVILEREPQADVVVMAAAVADYTVPDPADHKLKKGEGPLRLELTRTMDILGEIGARPRPGRLLVGFAAETGDGVEEARRKLERKRLDLIVVNDVSRRDAGFEVDTNAVTYVDANGVEPHPLTTKDEVAEDIVGRILALRASKMPS